MNKLKPVVGGLLCEFPAFCAFRAGKSVACLGTGTLLKCQLNYCVLLHTTRKNFCAGSGLCKGDIPTTGSSAWAANYIDGIHALPSEVRILYL